MKERTLLKIAITEDDGKVYNFAADCPVSNVDDGLVLSDIFRRIMDRNPFFAAAIETAYTLHRDKMADLINKIIPVKEKNNNPQS